MPIVSTAPIAIQNDNSPHTQNADGQVDLALLLSEYYGKNIRQGQNFTVTAVQATLCPANNTAAAIDAGISATVNLMHIPTQKHSRKAWNMVFDQWRAQKRLAGAVGSNVRYDDMEFAWGIGKATSRTSTIYSTGMGDSNTEQLVLTGDSTGGSDFSLADFYNTAHPSAAVSKSHFDDSVIKPTKFGDTPFPSKQSTWVTATNSARQGIVKYDIDVGTEDEQYVGLTSAISMNHLQQLPEPIQAFCGLFEYHAFVMPDDTVVQVEEDFDLILTFHVQKWRPLVFPRPKARKSKGRSSYRKGRWTHKSKRSRKRSSYKRRGR